MLLIHSFTCTIKTLIFCHSLCITEQMSIETGKQDTILIQYLEKQTSSLVKYMQYLSFVTFWKTELALCYFVTLDRLGLTRNLPGRGCNTGFWLLLSRQHFFGLGVSIQSISSLIKGLGAVKWINELCGKLCRAYVTSGLMGGSWKISPCFPLLTSFCLGKAITGVVSVLVSLVSS